jgi:Ser/Thr protein kinase RdoA (MazF antagonist)
MISSVTDYGEILNVINSAYNINGSGIKLHRTSGAKVYYIDCDNGKSVFKLYRNIHTPDALQTIRIITYLRHRGYPCVPIIPTADGKTHITMDMQGEEGCVGVLSEFVEGDVSFALDEVKEDNSLWIHPDFDTFGQQIGTLHRLMDSHDGQLLHRGKEYYIDRFISLLRRDRYSDEKTAMLERYGNELWQEWIPFREVFATATFTQAI